MRYRSIFRILAYYLYLLCLPLSLALALAIYYQFYALPQEHPQPHSTVAFAATLGLCLLLALLFHALTKGSSKQVYQREGYMLVILVWLLTGAVAALPFYLSGTLGLLDSYFEASSGLTTTGATLLHPKCYDPTTGEELWHHGQQSHGHSIAFHGTITPVCDIATGVEIYRGIEAVSKALLLWRSLLQWLGGIGFVVLFVAALPALRAQGKLLFQAEVWSSLQEGLTPRIKETAAHLWKIYLTLSLLLACSLYLTNPALHPLDIATLTLSTISTGGFSIHNDNLAFYNHRATEGIVTLFMFLGSLSFSLYFYTAHKKYSKLYDPEFLLYLFSLLVGCGLVSYHLLGTMHVSLNGITTPFTFFDAFYRGSFQYLSTQTSTGYALTNYDTWPPVCRLCLWFGMFLGGMSGSTAGGIKVLRYYMTCYIIKYQLRSIVYPHAVYNCLAGPYHLNATTQMRTLTFFVLFFGIGALSLFSLTLDGLDLSTSFGVVACMLNNSGVGFDLAGPSSSFAFLTPFGKVLSIFLMVLGRLEFFVLLVLFMPVFWRGKSGAT